MSSFATFGNVIEVCKIGTFQRNIFPIFLKVLNIYLFSKIFQKVEIVMLRWNILQYSTRMLRQYFNCNEIYAEIICWHLSVIFCAIWEVSSENSQYVWADLPCEIWENLPQLHSFTCNRLTATMFEIFMLSTTPRIR